MATFPSPPEDGGRAAMKRLMGEGAFLDDRGGHFRDKRYLVAPPGWPSVGADWLHGVGPTWERAFVAYGEAIVKHGLTPIAEALGRFSYMAHDEHRLYLLLERILREAGLTFVREHPLDKKNRLDFWFPELRVAMEVKVRGAPHRVMSQITRYAEHPDVGAILLATTLAKLCRVPDCIAGKPARAVRLAGAFG